MIRVIKTVEFSGAKLYSFDKFNEIRECYGLHFSFFIFYLTNKYFFSRLFGEKSDILLRSFLYNQSSYFGLWLVKRKRIFTDQKPRFRHATLISEINWFRLMIGQKRNVLIGYEFSLSGYFRFWLVKKERILTNQKPLFRF